MSIVVKKVGKNTYAYLAYRRGRKVVQKYLGPLADPMVRQAIEEIKAEEGVPHRFNALFWDASPAKINIRRNAPYIIERVLELGDLDAVRWIQKVYPTRLIIECNETSRKVSEKSKNFWRIWFGISNPA